MNYVIISGIALSILLSCYALSIKKVRSMVFPVGRDRSPLLRFSIPLLIGAAAIGAEAFLFYPRGPRGYGWIWLAAGNGIACGGLNMLRTRKPALWKGMLASWAVFTGILMAPLFPLMLLILAMIAMKTLVLWPPFVLVLIICALLHKAGKLPALVGVLFDIPGKQVEEFLHRNKRWIYSLYVMLIAMPFFIIALFYVMMYWGSGPSIGPMGH